MAITPRTYVPLLRWRMGEYQALERLGPVQKAATVPLLELLPPDYDFELRKPKKDIDDHLRLFGPRVFKKWGTQPALVDAGRLNPASRMADDRHPLTYLFDEARALGSRPIPVTTLDRDTPYQEAVRFIDALDLRGAALRCTLAEALDPDFNSNVEALLDRLEIEVNALDILIDLETPAFDPQDILVNVIIAALSSATVIADARSVTLLATSFPDTLANLTLAFQQIPRREWMLYKAVIAVLPAGMRRPGFGDYGIAALNFAQGDMRFMRSSPNIRYTIDDAWMIARARGAPRGSNQAYPSLCGLVTGSGAYLGRGYSAGSEYIDNCRTGAASRGNSTTWKWVGTNHHITKVLDDLAKLP